MVAGIGIQLITFVYMSIEMVRRGPLQLKPYLGGSLGCLTASLCFFTSLILFYLKFEWELAELNFGWPIMGWNEEVPDKPDYIETAGYPYIIAWVAEVILLFNGYLFFYTKCQEEVFINEEKRKQEDKERMLDAFADVLPTNEIVKNEDDLYL